MSDIMSQQQEMLLKIEQLQQKLDNNEKYPGISCSKPQDNCFQNWLSARECPAEQICQTVDSEKQIFRCKTPSISHQMKCGLLVAFIIMVIFIVIAIFQGRMKTNA